MSLLLGPGLLVSCFIERREHDGHRGAFSKVAVHHYASSEGLNDFDTHRQAQASALTNFFGGEERIKNAVDILFCNARSSVFDGDDNSLSLSNGVDGDFTAI